MKFIPQPHDAVFPLLRGEQLQTLPSCRMIGCVADILEDGRDARKSVDQGVNELFLLTSNWLYGIMGHQEKLKNYITYFFWI